MVLPYGGTEFSIRQYVEDWYEEELAKRGLVFDRPWFTTFSHTRYLTKHILASISNIVKGAVAGMNWLRQVADICTDKQTPIEWVTPTGFKVYQAVQNYTKTTISTVLGQKHKIRTVGIPADSFSKRGQANGLSPNFIHSYDAAIMMKTTNGMPDGTSLSMVHDSFGTHAEDCPTLALTLRTIVVEMFDGVNVLRRFKRQMEKALQTELPEPPELGLLDIKEVMNSRYFFA